MEQFTTFSQFRCHCLLLYQNLHVFLVIQNSSNKRRIGGAALIRWRRLLTFLSQMRRLFEGGAYSSKLLVFSVTQFKIDGNKKSKPFNRLSPESGNRKKVHLQRPSPRFRSQQFFLWKICGETFSPNL